MTEKKMNIQFQSTLLQEERQFFTVYEWYHDDFNPRSYKRSDKDNSTLRPSIGDFNPRSYKRSDLIGETYAYVMGDFNPRSYKRSDVSFLG